MSSEFQSDLRELQKDLAGSGEELLHALEPLTNSDLERGRRGGWTIGQVLGHVIQSEYLYGGVVAAIVGASSGSPLGERPTSIDAARQQLNCRFDGEPACLSSSDRFSSCEFGGWRTASGARAGTSASHRFQYLGPSHHVTGDAVLIRALGDSLHMGPCKDHRRNRGQRL